VPLIDVPRMPAQPIHPPHHDARSVDGRGARLFCGEASMRASSTSAAADERSDAATRRIHYAMPHRALQKTRSSKKNMLRSGADRQAHHARRKHKPTQPILPRPVYRPSRDC
jgi:hypothetical protein